MKATIDLSKADKLIIFDYSAIAYQAYYSNLANPYGRFIDICLSIIKASVRFGDTFAICFAIDSVPTRKLLLYREYKGKRKKGDVDPKEVLLPCLDLFKALRYKVQGEEADDIIATICAQNRDKQKVIATTDSDLNAMISKTTRVINPKTLEFVRGDSTTALITILEKYCRGDSSDNIPPVRKRIRGELVKDIIIEFIDKIKQLTSVRAQFFSFAKDQSLTKFSEDELKQLDLNMELITPKKDLVLSPEIHTQTLADWKEFLSVSEDSLFDFPLVGFRDVVDSIQSRRYSPTEEILFSGVHSPVTVVPAEPTGESYGDDLMGDLDELFGEVG